MSRTRRCRSSAGPTAARRRCWRCTAGCSRCWRGWTWTSSTLHLSGRGSWRVELDNGATVELGRGSEDEVLARSERFVRTVSQVTGRYRQPLLYADLRHTDGYAVRLRGVSTTAPAVKTIN